MFQVVGKFCCGADGPRTTPLGNLPEQNPNFNNEGDEMETRNSWDLMQQGAQRRKLLALGAGSIAATFLPAAARAQVWPSKPIRIIAAQAPGSSNDNTARAFADFFSTNLGVPVVVENRPGGVGMIAADAVARSTDGHTFLLTLHSQLAQAPVLLKKPPIDPGRDLSPIASISTGVGPMVVKKELPVTNIKELIELARKRPISVGNYGLGSGWQLMVIQMAKQTGAQFDIINYKGTGPMLYDLISGQIDVGAGSLAGLSGAIQNGSIRALAIISGSTRSSKLPGIPTLIESGMNGQAFTDLVECNMLLGPAGTPKSVVDRLATLVHESVRKSARVMAVRDQLGADDVPMTGEALQKFIERTWPTYRALTLELGLKVD